MTRPSIVPVSLAWLALACTPIDKPAEERPAATSDERAAADPSKDPLESPVEAPIPAPPPTTETDLGGFRLVALREGPLDLAVWNDRPFSIASGEPIPIDAEGLPQRAPDMLAGLQPRSGMFSYDQRTLAFAGELDGDAWVTSVQEQDRAASAYDVYRRGEGRWQRQALERGPLVEFYPAFVSREGALLGLRAYSSNPLQDIYEGEDDSGPALAFRRKLEKALAAAPQGFVHLSGPKPSAPPELAEDLVPFAAVASTDGTIYALALSAEVAADSAATTVLLAWPPGQRAAQVLALPGYEGSGNTSLTASGEVALIGAAYADKPYLAMARGTEVTQLGVAGIEAGDDTITSAARSPSGDLWAVLGSYNFEDGGKGASDALWTKPAAAETWTRVALPTPSPELTPTDERWVWDAIDEGWTQHRRLAAKPEPAALSVAHAQGAVYVIADVGELWASESMTTNLRRTGLFTTAAGEAEPLAIESLDISHARQYAALDGKPGGARCPYITLVLGDPEQADAFEAKLAALDGEELPITVLELYVGELAGTRELVLGLRGYDPKTVKAGIRELAEQLGLSNPKVDCKPRILVEMVSDLL